MDDILFGNSPVEIKFKFTSGSNKTNKSDGFVLISDTVSSSLQQEAKSIKKVNKNRFFLCFIFSKVTANGLV